MPGASRRIASEARDTTNAADGVSADRAVASFLFETERTSEGVPLAYKTLIVATG